MRIITVRLRIRQSIYRQTDRQTDSLSVTITNLHMSMVHKMFTTFC